MDGHKSGVEMPKESQNLKTDPQKLSQSEERKIIWGKN